MRTKQTTLATAIALSLATSGLVASGQVWADTSTRSLKAVIDRAPASDGTITINAGETINLAALGIDQDGKVDTRGEQLGAVIFMSVATDKGEIFVGSDTPGERENNPDPVVGGFHLGDYPEKPFNNLKYIRLVQGAGRANIYYPPTINTPPIVEPTTTDNRQYDECCGLPCADKLPAGTLNCPTDTREDAVKLEPVVENVKVTLQERFLNKSGGVEYKVIDSVSKKINIMPAIPHVRKLEIVKFEAGPRDRDGMRATTLCLPADKASKKCDDDPNDGIEGHMTAGVAGARVTVWALKDTPGQAKGLGKDPAANGKLVLKLVAMDRKTYKELPAVNMLNGEGQVTFPSDLTLAGDFYIEIELRLAVNGHMDTTNPLALPTVVNNVDMFTADKVIVEPTKKVSKLKLESIKKVISDDANPPQGTPFNPGAAWNAATQISVYVLDEYGNKTQLPAGTATKVTVTDSASAINAGSLNLTFNTADPNRKGPDMAKDWIGDGYGDVLKLGETSLVATIDGSGIGASDPLKIKVVAKNLVARPYAGSPVAGDTGYGDVVNGVPAANAPYPTSTTRYKPNTTNVIKDLQAGTSVKAFSVAVDGGRLNGIPNGLFDDYKSPTDGSILPNLADGANSDDDFVSKTNAATLVIRTPAGESVETTLAQPVYAVDATGAQVVQETVQADGTKGQGARAEVLFTKPVNNPDPMGKYFIIGDKAGQYGEALVYLPGNIKPSAASKAKIYNAHGYEPTAKDKNGKDKLDENGQPIIQLDAQLDYPTKDGTFQVLLPAKNIKLGDEYGNSVSAGAGGTFSPTSSNGAPKLVTLDQYGNPGTMMNTRSIRATAALPPGQTKPDGTIDAYLLSYDSEKFAGTDRISLGFTSPGVKPRTVEVTVPPTPKLTTIKAEVEQTELPVNSIIAITVRSFDQNGFPIDALANTTVTFSGTILQTGSIWRVTADNPNGAPSALMNSGEVVRPEGGDQQVLVMNVGNKAGEFTLTFTNPNIAADATAQTLTIKASDKYVPPPVCAKATPAACTTEEMCTAASGTWKDNSCQFEAVKDAAQCQKDGGLYVLDTCHPVLGADGKPSGEVNELEGASSAEPTYDSTKPEKANFFGGVMITSGGERTTYKFETPVTIMLNDKVSVGGVIRVEDVDKGKKADLLATGYHVSNIYSNGFNWYMAVQCAGNDFTTIPTCPSYGWQIKQLPYDETGYPIFYKLEPFKSVTLPGNPGDNNPAYQSFEMYKGNFPVTAEASNPLRIYYGYMVTEGVNAGKVIYNGKPIEVIIKKPGQ
jgi:hypothetical protein